MLLEQTPRNTCALDKVPTALPGLPYVKRTGGRLLACGTPDFATLHEMSHAALAELRNLGGADFVRDVVEIFANNMGALLARVQAGLWAEEDKPDAARAARCVANRAGQLGQVDLEAVAREVEAAFRQGGSIGASRLAALSVEAERSVATLRRAALE